MSNVLLKRIFSRAVVLIFAALLMITEHAAAHNVIIFAWVEGDTIYTESKFSGGRAAKDAPVEVYDATGTKLLTGKTDEKGEFSFKIPKKEDLKIVLKAGMGHGNEWVVTAADIAEAQGETAAAAAEPEASYPAEAPVPRNASGPETGPETKTTAMTADSQAALEKMLDKKLAPVLKKLSHLEAKQKEGAGVTEIFGGIGYILGLIGLAVYMRFRRNGNGGDK